MTDYEAEADVVDDVIDGPGDAGLFQFADETDNVGSETTYVDGQEQPTSGEDATDWEAEAKKFQSLYDKSSTKVQDLEKMEPLKNLLEMRPDLVQKLQEGIVGGQEGQNANPSNELTEEEFNPWDAYYKPDSPSYQFRQKQEKGMVNEALQGHLAAIDEQNAIKQTVSDLRNVHRLEDDEVKDFLEWSTQPKEAVGLNTLLKVWRDATGKKGDTEVMNSVDAARQTKTQPKTAAASHGMSPRPKSDTDSAWDSVVGANQSGRLP